MAYVTARRPGRFEVRESVHTPAGPRSRTLATFRVLDSAVLQKAEERARRPFSRDAVVESARRAGAVVATLDSAAFAEASRRFARQIERRPAPSGRSPGDVLLDLLDFADEVRRSRVSRDRLTAGRPPLSYPILAELSRR